MKSHKSEVAIIDVTYLPSLTSATVVGKLKNFFSHHGVPETVVSDNGTKFSSAEYGTFADRWNFSHVTSSPHYLQSNGAAERAVETVKEILRQDDIFLALLSYRSAPIPDLGSWLWEESSEPPCHHCHRRFSHDSLVTRKCESVTQS